MKKIAGITWWKGNYGSILQAYALNKIIDRMEIVDYEILQQFTFNSFSMMTLLSYLKSKGIAKTISLMKRKFGNKMLLDRKKKCEAFIKMNMTISDNAIDCNNLKSIEKEYDGFICGSDQIWNPAFTNCDSIYWLNFSDSVIKISYAPSIGVTEVNEDTAIKIRKALSSYKAISCREYAGSMLINRILGSDICKTVLDPTFLLEKKEWDLVASERLIKEKYVFCYFLRGNDTQKKIVKKYAKDNGLKLVTIPFLESDYYSKLDGKYADINMTDASPQDFISLIKYAEYIFTDSFHCIVFSSIYHRPFFVFRKKGKNQMLRINDLQEWLCLGKRVVENENDIYALQSEDIGNIWKQFDSRLFEERQHSFNYLYEALS